MTKFSEMPYQRPDLEAVKERLSQLTARLKELGCVDAVLFDGGGSTTFGATGALDAAFSLQNKPSDGGQRAVTNALFFLSELKPTGELGSLHITPQSGLFLPGGKAVLTAQGIDSGYYPMTAAVGAATYDVSGPGAVAGNVLPPARPLRRPRRWSPPPPPGDSGEAPS